MRSQLRSSLTLFFLLTLLTGLLYPFAVTAASQALFPAQANGSILVVNGQALGSVLIGQPFDDPRYFWGRPSAAGYNAAASTASNLGPNNPALLAAVQARIAALQAANPGNLAPIPADLVTASASGLDPHISVAAAQYQAARVARVRGLEVSQVETLIAQATEGRQFGLLGEARVNVLKLNLALDGLQ